jgi:hypothetical protein
MSSTWVDTTWGMPLAMIWRRPGKRASFNSLVAVMEPGQIPRVTRLASLTTWKSKRSLLWLE